MVRFTISSVFAELAPPGQTASRTSESVSLRWAKHQERAAARVAHQPGDNDEFEALVDLLLAGPVEGLTAVHGISPIARTKR